MMQTGSGVVEDVVMRVTRGTPVETNERMQVTGFQPGAVVDGHLYAGDTIAAVQGRPIINRMDLSLLFGASAGKSVKVRVTRGPNSPSLALPLRTTCDLNADPTSASLATGSTLSDPNNSSGASSLGSNKTTVSMASEALPVGLPGVPMLNGWSGNSVDIPPGWEPLLRRRPGYEYRAVQVDWPRQPTRKLGITLSYHSREVVVSMLAPGSLGDEAFQLLDRIVAVNGASVRNESVAKEMMVSSGGRFIALVERPVSPEAHQSIAPPDFVSSMLMTTPDQSGSLALPKDVLGIAELQRKRHRATAHLAPPSILRTPATATGGKSILVEARPSQSSIPSDVAPEKALVHVPRNENP